MTLYSFSQFTVNGAPVAGPSAKITINGKTTISAIYIEEVVKVVKITNQTGAAVIAVKITITQTSYPIANGASQDIPFDPTKDAEIQIKPAA